MPIPLSQFARPFVVNARPRADLDHPVLLLEQQAMNRTPRQTTQPMPEPPVASTSSFGLIRASNLEPLVFEVTKAGKAANTFEKGVTFGRNSNNDLCISDDSVSGFHGYFEKDAATGVWSLVDVGSTNGTRLGGKKLELDASYPLGAREELVFGRVRLVFLSREMFFEHLDAISR